MISLTLNRKQYDVDVSPDTPLLWVIRDAIGLTGTKFGCGLQQCGACTVHLDGVAVRFLGLSGAGGGRQKNINIEGLLPAPSHPFQAAWIFAQGAPWRHRAIRQYNAARTLRAEQTE